jgi:hypothetical protein
MSEAERKVLFVVSDDHGELSNAVWMLLGRRFEAELLLTPRLLALNPDVLPARARPYTSVQEVIDVAQRLRPDAVFLLSGYLYAANGIFALDGMHELTRALRSLNTRIVTSDPFLGLLSTVTSAIAATDSNQQQLLQKLSAAGSALKNEWHVYPVMPESSPPARRVAFFNPRMLVPESDRAALRNGLAIHMPLDLQRPRWLYVLASEDYELQSALHGRSAFHALLVQRLEDAHRQGRQPVLIAPQACADAVRRASSGIPGALLLSFCSHGMFLGLLLEAEYAFYWNVFANSVPSRLVNQLPVFFFDSGHMARAIPALLELGLRTYYPGAQLPLLDIKTTIDPEALVPYAQREIASLTTAVRHLRAAATPDQMLETVLADS